MVPLPLEILEMVVYHFWDSQPELSSVSLISWDWVVPAQRQLFRSIKITVDRSKRRSYFPFPKLSSKKDSCHNLHGFVSFLGTSPHIGPYIKQLSLFSERARPILSLDSNSDFVLLLSKLQKLHFLSFFDMTFVASSKIAGGETHPLPLDHLSCDRITTTQASFSALMTRLSVRGSLYLNRFLLEDGEVNSSNLCPLDVPATALRLEAPRGPWLCFPNLSTLCVNVGSHRELEDFFARSPIFLLVNGVQLRQLRLGILRVQPLFMEWSGVDDVLRHVLPLSKVCPNLQRFAITLCVHNYGDALYLPLGYLRLVSVILSSLPQEMATLVFGLAMMSPMWEREIIEEDGPILQTRWQGLSEIVAKHTQLTSIRFLSVDYSCPTSMEEIVLFDEDCTPLDPVHQDFLEQNLRSLDALGFA